MKCAIFRRLTCVISNLKMNLCIAYVMSWFCCYSIQFQTIQAIFLLNINEKVKYNVYVLYIKINKPYEHPLVCNTWPQTSEILSTLPPVSLSRKLAESILKYTQRYTDTTICDTYTYI